MKRPVIQVDFSKNSIFKPILEYDYSSNIAYIEVNSVEKLSDFLSNINLFFDHDREYEKMKKQIYAKEKGVDNFFDDLDNFSDLDEVDDYLDSHTDVLSAIDEMDDLGNINVQDEKTKNEINKAEKKFESFYSNVINNNFDVELTIIDNISLEELKKVVTLLKNRITHLDISKFDINQISSLMKTVDIDNNVQIVTKYNYEDYCTKDDLIELLEYLNNIKNYILRFNLSPLEICIFVHDLIRERPYKKSEIALFASQLTDVDLAGIIQDNSNSRSIIKVFKSDEIVCAGFSNLYSAILDLVGIKSDTITYIPAEGNTVGHMTNLVYLNDEKYNIKGLYEIDTTWGRKEKEDGTYDYQGSLKNYYHFARPLKAALKIKESNKFRLYDFDLECSTLLTRINHVDIFFKNNCPNFLKISSTQLVIDTCLKLDQNFNNKYLSKEINDLKEIIVKIDNGENVNYKEIKSIIDNIYKKVFLCPLRSFKQALYRVKTIEHSIDKDKYPVTLEDIDEAYNSRINTSEERLIDSIFSNKDKSIDEQKLDIARMKFISVLHKLAKDDVNKNPTHHI